MDEKAAIFSSVRTDGTTVPLFLSGPLNGETFRKYIEQYLVPTLHTGDIVVMDNLLAIKSKGSSGPLKGLAHTSFIFRHTVPASIRLNRGWFHLDGFSCL
jgi:hypothetical protein